MTRNRDIKELERDVAYLEKNILKNSKCIDELRKTLDVVKNGLSEPGKAFTNPRHKTEKMISFFSGGSP